MAKQEINIGSAANAGDGDTLRASFNKTNQNFTEVYNDSHAAFVKANSATVLAQASFDKANGATTLAQAAFDQANTGGGGASTANIAFLGTDIHIASGAIETNLNISPNVEGWAYLQLPNDATANTANVRLHNDAGNIEITAGDASNDGGTKNWYFKGDGTMEFPSQRIDTGTNYIDIKSSNMVELWYSPLQSTWQNNPTNNEVGYLWVDGSGTHIQNYRGNDGEGGPQYDYEWDFQNDGQLKFASGNLNINKQRYGMGNVAAYLDAGWTICEYDGANYGTQGIRINPGVEGSADIVLPANSLLANTPVTIANYDNGGVEIQASGNTWNFSNTAVLTVPGAITGREVITNWSQAITNVFGDTTSIVTLTTARFGEGDHGRIAISGVNEPSQVNGTWYYEASTDTAIALYRDAARTIPVDGTSWTSYDSGGTASDVYTNGLSIKADTHTWHFRGDGKIALPNGGLIESSANNIDITNEFFNGGEVSITANTNVNVYGGDNTIPGYGGGSVNISAGTGGPDTGDGVGGGGMIELSGGLGADAINGGAGEGGEIRIVAGPGGDANVENSIVAGIGGRVFIMGGTAGDTGGNDALSVNGPHVEIHGGLGSFAGSNMIGRPGDVITQGGGDGWIGASGNVITKTSSDGYSFHTWKYDNLGRTIFPSLSTVRGDTTNGNLSGYTLRMGAGDAEAVITTPDGSGDYIHSQRLVINPGKGADETVGEGGDIYLWAGRGGSAGGSGGDIKIRGGQGMGTSGAGGYIRMEAGDGSTDAGSPGYIELLGGTSGSGLNGGYVSVRGGFGQVDGGDTEIRGGSGNSGLGGEVNIIGGDSNQGAGSHGNVTIATGSSTWYFRNNGFMDLPGEGVLQSTNDTITLRSFNTTSGFSNSVYLGTSGGLGFTDESISANWLEIFRSGASPQIKSFGDLLLTANASTWNFGNTGTLTLPGDLFATGDLALQISSGVPTGVANWDGGGGWNQGAYNNLSTTGGTGTGLTVDVAAGGSGYISIEQITIANPGSGYTDGDVITINNENDITGTFTLTVGSTGWQFNGNGTTSLPGPILKLSVATANTVGSGDPAYPTAIDLTKTIAKLADNNGSWYTLANGSEGQILYLVPQTGTTDANTSVTVAHARILDSAGSTTATVYTDVSLRPFASIGSDNIPNVVTMIFTDGAWQTSAGIWD